MAINATDALTMLLKHFRQAARLGKQGSHSPKRNKFLGEKKISQGSLIITDFKQNQPIMY